MARVLYDDPSILYDDPDVLYEQPTPEAPKGIEAWVSTPAAVYIAHLDRSEESPFRDFWFGLIRNQSGVGRLEYHLDNAIVREHPTIFAKGNLVHMRYRTREFVWVVRENGSGLGSDESAGDWVKVSGPGVWPHRRLVFPPDFDEGANLDPSTWATQWRSFINRAAGELLWDVLNESNPRFVTHFLRGIVENTGGSDGITADYRFEDIGEDVFPSVLAARGGEVRFDGLTFNYFNAGHGSDLSGSVIFEEGADLVSLEYSSTNRDALTWVVGEGVGEGVFSKLAVSEGVAAERMEGFYAAKEASNVPLLELMTDAALDEHDDDFQALAIEVDESRFKAFTDFNLSDTIRVVAPSRGVNHSAPIVAMYVAEDGDRVRIAFDLGEPRTPPDVRTAEAVKQARSEIGVRNRQPQGQLVPVNSTGSGVFDEDDTMDTMLHLLDEVYVTVRVVAAIAFKPYFAPATAASTGGGATSGSGGSSTPTTASGGGSSPTSDSAAAHRHQMFDFALAGPIATTIDEHNARDAGGGPVFVYFGNGGNTDLYTWTSDGAHSHVVTIGGHQHSVTIAAHDHSTPSHGHGLTYAVLKEAYPASHNVTLTITKWNGSAWTAVATITGLTGDVEVLDVSQHVTGPGLWRFSLQSAAGQPNGGRLAADISVAAEGAIKSA